MFDISWTEFLLIGIVALVVIGPKELPGVMRTIGQYTRKIRGMATDFQNQFQEAMREAEMADLKKQVDDMAQRHQELRSAQERARRPRDRMGKDIEKSLDRGPGPSRRPPTVVRHRCRRHAAAAAAGAEPGRPRRAGAVDGCRRRRYTERSAPASRRAADRV